MQLDMRITHTHTCVCVCTGLGTKVVSEVLIGTYMGLVRPSSRFRVFRFCRAGLLNFGD